MFEARPIPLALKKGHRWWNGRRFVRHNGPLWFKTMPPGEWSYRFPEELPRGRYSAFHHRNWPGLTRVDFRLL